MTSVYTDTCIGRGDKTNTKNTCSVIVSILFLGAFFVGPIIMSFIQWGYVDTMTRGLETTDCGLPMIALSESDLEHCAYDLCKTNIGTVAGSDFTYFSRWNGGVMGISWLASGVLYFLFVWVLVRDSATREYLDQHKKDAAIKYGENEEAQAERHAEKSSLSFRKLFMYVFTARSAEVFPWTVVYCTSLLLSVSISFTMNYTFLWLMFNEATTSIGDAVCVIDVVNTEDTIMAADGIPALRILYVKIVFFLISFVAIMSYLIITAFWVSFDPLHIEPDAHGNYTPVTNVEMLTGSIMTEHENGTTKKRSGPSAHHLLQSRNM